MALRQIELDLNFQQPVRPDVVAMHEVKASELQSQMGSLIHEGPHWIEA